MIDTKIKNAENCLKSSSGGIFILIAKNIISEGDIIFGAAFNDQFEVEHQSIETKEGFVELRGFKYIQSSIKNAYLRLRAI